MSPSITYTVFATGLSSVEGAPIPGFVAGGQALFAVGSDGFGGLPTLRQWIEQQGGTVLDETGTPAPARSVETGKLYAVSLGPPKEVEVTGVTRVTQPCEDCRLSVQRLRVEGPEPVADGDLPDPVVSTASACWLAELDVVDGLRDDDLVGGLAGLPVRAPAGQVRACWPDRLLSSRDPGIDGVRRCSTCLRNVDALSVNPREWVPRYSLGLIVDRPSDPSGWWWHARLGQHLPILSGDVVRRLRAAAPGLSALPVIVDPDEAFLPEEYR